MNEEKFTQTITDLVDRYPGVIMGHPTYISLREWQRFSDEEFIFLYSMPKAKFIAPEESRTYKFIENRRRMLQLNRAKEI